MGLRKIIPATSEVGAAGSQEKAQRTGYGANEQIKVIDDSSLDEGRDLEKKRNGHT